jgi:hypothetical protein
MAQIFHSLSVVCLGLALGRPTPGQAGELEISGERPRIMQTARSYWNFDRKNLKPALGNEVRMELQGDPCFAPAGSGYALDAVKGRQVSFELDSGALSQPGAIAFWVSPRAWTWGSTRENQYLLKIGWGGRKIFAMRQGMVHREGEAPSRLEGFFLYLGQFPGLPANFATPVATGDQVTWSPESWHLLVLSWDGASFTLCIDATSASSVSLPEMPTGNERPRITLGDCVENTLIDDLVLFNRDLSRDEAAALFRAGKL